MMSGSEPRHQMVHLTENKTWKCETNSCDGRSWGIKGQDPNLESWIL